MNIREYLQNGNVIIADGAMGTYYYEKYRDKSTLSEKENLVNCELIKQIHIEYIEAGAKLIRTNSFAANSVNFSRENGELEKVILNSINTAKEAVLNREIYIGASIGPVVLSEDKNENYFQEYKYIADIFIKNGIDIFLFETFSSYDKIIDVIKYIKEQKNDSFIIVQFALTTNGETRKGISADEIIKKMREHSDIIDCYGFNCGTGPMHMFNNIKGKNFNKDIVSVLPNAGFPEIVNERTVYTQSPDYFASIMEKIVALGIKIAGGCCGTTPQHIKKIAELLKRQVIIQSGQAEIKESMFSEERNSENRFEKKIKNGEFVIAVELDPPFNSDLTKIIDAAEKLKESPVDIITVSDSPIGKVRCSSIVTAARIKRECGIDAMPHLCCRDRNIIGIKSDITGAKSENISNFLFVTGDPIPSAERNEVKSVFNFNSMGLMELGVKINESEDKNRIFFGGALNLNVVKKEIELERMVKKREKGASFFLTQPVYDDNTVEFIQNNREILCENRVLIGIMPLVSYSNAMFLNNEIPGITIPDKYIGMFDSKMTREEAEAAGENIAVEIAEKVIHCGAGLYFITPFNRAAMINRIIKRLKIN